MSILIGHLGVPKQHLSITHHDIISPGIDGVGDLLIFGYIFLLCQIACSSVAYISCKTIRHDVTRAVYGLVESRIAWLEGIYKILGGQIEAPAITGPATHHGADDIIQRRRSLIVEEFYLE